MKNRVFNIFGTEYEIRYVKNTFNEKGEWVYGNINYLDRVISVSTHTPENNILPGRVLKNTLLHELMHAIYNEGSYINEAEDEPIVEWTAKCILSLLEQKIL